MICWRQSETISNWFQIVLLVNVEEFLYEYV